MRETTNEAVAPFFNGGGEDFLHRVDVSLDYPSDDTSGPNDYEAFIWHYFAEESMGPQVVGSLWTAAEAMTSNAAMNSVFPWATHFRELIVRNWNDNSVAAAELPTYNHYYIVVGWFVGPEVLLMKLNGPYPGSITEKDIADGRSNSYMSTSYVKKR